MTVKDPRKPVPVKTFKTFLVSVHRNLPVLAKLFAFVDVPSHFAVLSTFWGKFRFEPDEKQKETMNKMRNTWVANQSLRDDVNEEGAARPTGETTTDTPSLEVDSN